MQIYDSRHIKLITMPPKELLITEVFDIFFDFTVLCNTETFVF